MVEMRVDSLELGREIDKASMESLVGIRLLQN